MPSSRPGARLRSLFLFLFFHLLSFFVLLPGVLICLPLSVSPLLMSFSVWCMHTDPLFSLVSYSVFLPVGYGSTSLVLFPFFHFLPPRVSLSVSPLLMAFSLSGARMQTRSFLCPFIQSFFQLVMAVLDRSSLSVFLYLAIQFHPSPLPDFI